MINLFLIIALICRVCMIEGFLDDCPIDRGQQIGNDSIIHVLETFYKDLIFVRACTRSQQPRKYVRLFKDMNKSYHSDEHMRFGGEDFRSERYNAYSLTTNALKLLNENQVRGAMRLIDRDFGKPHFAFRNWVGTYLNFIKAEVRRLSGDYEMATDALLESLADRQEYTGVSVNHLERLDGLLALQKVSQYNRNFDTYLHISENASYQARLLIHSISKDELQPLSELRAEMVSRLPWVPWLPLRSDSDSSGADSDDEYVETGPVSNPEFSGQSVSMLSVERIFCEFGQRLNMIGGREIRNNVVASDYSDVIDQLKQLDANLAQLLDEQIVKYIDTDIRRARKGAWSKTNKDLFSSFRGDENYKSMFLSYFHIELNYLQSEDACSNIFKLWGLPHIFSSLIEERVSFNGLSMGKLLELEARIVLHHLRCFHERVRLAYELDGSEDDQQLQSKWSELGASTGRILPIQLEWNREYL